MTFSTLTILYVGELWRASLAMNGVDVETENYPDNLPSDLKATYRELEKMDSRAQAGAATADVKETLEAARKFRAAMVKQIRPDVFTSEPYRKFVEQYRRDSEVSSPSGPGEETVYSVWREGLMFTMVERAGTIRILWVAPMWLD